METYLFHTAAFQQALEAFPLTARFQNATGWRAEYIGRLDFPFVFHVLEHFQNVLVYQDSAVSIAGFQLGFLYLSI